MAEEATAVIEPVVQDTTVAASAPAEVTTEVDEQTRADQAVAKSLSEAETEEAEPEKVEPVGEAKEQPQAKGYEQRKEQLTGDITSLVAQRNELRKEVEELNSKVYRPATEQELQDQGMSPEMAAIEAFKQEQQIRDYNTQVAETQLSLRSEALSIVRDFPDLSPVLLNGEKNPTYNEAVGSQLDALLGKNLQYDENTGQIIGSTIPPYQIYKLVADAQKAAGEAGRLKGQQSTEEMLSRVDSTSSAAPPAETEKDNFLKGLLGDR